MRTKFKWRKMPLALSKCDFSKKDISRFWAHVDKKSRCWIWKASCNKYGYGKFAANGKDYRAHRVAFALLRGAVSRGDCVLHKCDNRPCVRHLFLGSHIENGADMKRKGRAARGDKNGARLHPERRARGERNGDARLTLSQVRKNSNFAC